MSCRHAVPPSPTTATINAESAELAEKPWAYFLSVLRGLCVDRDLLVRNGRHPPRAQRFEKPASRLEIELRVLRLDAQEKSVAARQREAGHGEDPGIGHR